MGVVVAARHLNLGELFAIKFLLPSATEYPQAIERFLREARAAARLKGEHVAKVVDVGTLESGAPYMVMEYLDGLDLRKLLRQRGALPVDEAVTYLFQACDALEEAHSIGIVHRDIKPANLFLTRRRNGSPCVKVLDFGIAKQLGGQNVDLTNTNTSFGSPLYMSPEQMIRAKSVDTRTDIWSIGVVLYELVTATTPFQADTPTEVVGRVLQEEPLRPSQLRADLPRWLDVVIMGCLQKSREQRYQSIRDLANALAARDGATIATLPRESRSSIPGNIEPLSGTAKPQQALSSSIESRSAQTGAAWGQTSGQATRPRMWLGFVAGGAALALAVTAAGLWLGFRSSPDDPSTTPKASSSSAHSVSPSLPGAVPELPSTAMSTQAPAGTRSAPIFSVDPIAAGMPSSAPSSTGKTASSAGPRPPPAGNKPSAPKPTSLPLD